MKYKIYLVTEDEARGPENGENRVTGSEKVGDKDKDLVFVDLTSDCDEDERPLPVKEAAPPPPVVPPLSREAKLEHAFSG